MNESNNKHYGWVEHEGRKLYLQQAPYLCGTNESVKLRAFAKCGAGIEYFVYWIPYDNYEEIDDDLDICDWDKYTVEIA